MLRKACGSFVLMRAGELPGDPEVEQSRSLSDVLPLSMPHLKSSHEPRISKPTSSSGFLWRRQHANVSDQSSETGLVKFPPNIFYASAAYVEGRFGGDAGSGGRMAASAGTPWSGRWAAGFCRVDGSTITFAPIFTRS